MATASYEAIKLRKQIARDMGIRLSELKIPAMPEDAKDITRRADNVAEKFGTYKFDAENNDWATAMRNVMRESKAAIAARKIARAIPATKDAIVTTKVGYDVVTISRVERAANVAAIRRQLIKGIQRERAAMNARAEQEDIEARKTNLERAPKAVVRRSKRLSAVADREHARVRFLRRRLARATSQRVANNLTYSRVGDVRLSLRPQSMANQVARLVMNIPDRKDVHPFRELPRIRKVTGTTATAIIGKPENELIWQEDKAVLDAARKERDDALAEERAAIAARDAEIESARKAELEAARIARRDQKRIDNAEKYEATRIADTARRALRAKIRRQNSKKYASPKKMK
jgi:hypothetical protein